jgi:NADH-quinone oxidoreductase subunit J
MEVALFLIVGLIAVVAAVGMLLVKQPVHSALLLITNFACVAFFYLMLDAPFLAMVQIAVYAGAIMVLFLFVIMLLGAEKVTGENTHLFKQFSVVALVVTVVFFLAGTAIPTSKPMMANTIMISTSVKPCALD